MRLGLSFPRNFHATKQSNFFLKKSKLRVFRMLVTKHFQNKSSLFLDFVLPFYRKLVWLRFNLNTMIGTNVMAGQETLRSSNFFFSLFFFETERQKKEQKKKKTFFLKIPNLENKKNYQKLFAKQTSTRRL